MKKGAIFDLDGTMVDTIALHAQIWEKLFLQHGISLSTEEKKTSNGKTNLAFTTEVLKARRIDSLDPAQLAEEKDMLLLEFLALEGAPISFGIVDVLETLKEEKIKLALATSATRQTALLLAKDLLHYFEVTVFGDEVKQGKPNPDIFLLAAERMELEATDCVVFEDSTSGIEAAKSGGFLCIAKDNDIEQDLSRADFVITEYNTKILKEASVL